MWFFNNFAFTGVLFFIPAVFLISSSLWLLACTNNALILQMQPILVPEANFPAYILTVFLFFAVVS